jgi:hypothetical protein
MHAVNNTLRYSYASRGSKRCLPPAPAAVCCQHNLTLARTAYLIQKLHAQAAHTRRQQHCELQSCTKMRRQGPTGGQRPLVEIVIIVVIIVVITR